MATPARPGPPPLHSFFLSHWKVDTDLFVTSDPATQFLGSITSFFPSNSAPHQLNTCCSFSGDLKNLALLLYIPSNTWKLKHWSRNWNIEVTNHVCIRYFYLFHSKVQASSPFSVSFPVTSQASLILLIRLDLFWRPWEFFALSPGTLNCALPRGQKVRK